MRRTMGRLRQKSVHQHGIEVSYIQNRRTGSRLTLTLAKRRRNSLVCAERTGKVGMACASRRHDSEGVIFVTQNFVRGSRDAVPLIRRRFCNWSSGARRVDRECAQKGGGCRYSIKRRIKLDTQQRGYHAAGKTYSIIQNRDGGESRSGIWRT